MSAATPAQLVELASSFAGGADRKLGASRFLAAALLLRQALEASLDQLWNAQVPGLAACSGRAQLVSLPFFLSDDELAQDVVYCWHRLSHACHHDEYDLPPTGLEVQHLAGIVKRLDRATTC